ncbi:MAG: hypothetical protein K9H84_01335 [Bacteroidales bacterium]|nr:hypothetical protein [Bacteroidales bacterium]
MGILQTNEIIVDKIQIMRLLIPYKLFVVLIIVWLSGLPLCAVAQFSIHNQQVDKNVKSAFSAMYNFQFKKANRLVRSSIENDTNNAWYYFTVSNIQLWEIFAGSTDDEFRNDYRENLNQHLHYCDNLLDEKEARFLRIMHYAYMTRLTMDEEEYFAAFKAIRNYYHLLEPTFNDTTYAPYLLIDGLYFYLFGYAYDEYILLRPFLKFYKKGNSKAGLRYLDKAANSPDKIIRTEASYFLMKIWFELEKNPQKAFLYAQLLYHSYPGNFIFNFYYHKIKKAINPNYSPDLKEIRMRVIENSQLNKKQKMHFENLLKNQYPVKTPAN